MRSAIRALRDQAPDTHEERRERHRARRRAAVRRDAALSIAAVLGALVIICSALVLCVALATRGYLAWGVGGDYHGPGCQRWHATERASAATYAAISSLVGPFVH
jgi:hypothetical protein